MKKSSTKSSIKEESKKTARTARRPRFSKDQMNELRSVLIRGGQYILPMVGLIEQSKLAVDELIDCIGRVTIETVLILSAQQVAGPKRQGKRDGGGGSVGWHGVQGGRVNLAERRLTVTKPRLRTRGTKSEEVEIPAYTAMQSDQRLGERMIEILMNGVSSRSYEKVLPEMADSVGVSKSAVSREFIEASGEELRQLCERRFDELEILVIYIDGMVFGNHHLLVAIGVDSEGYKHVLGISEGASENATVARGLLEDIRDRGVKAGRRRLFVIDGSKALRAAIDQVYGDDNLVQRCRNHKITNVVGYLPEELKETVKATMKAAYRLDWKEGIRRLKKQSEWLEREYPTAARSLLEGLEETFTINRLALTKSLRRSLGTTNIIESPNAGVRRRTRRVSRWRTGEMVLRWCAAALIDAEKKFRRISGYHELWMLKAALDVNEASEASRCVDQAEKVA